jgi:hypothetical protein
MSIWLIVRYSFFILLLLPVSGCKVENGFHTIIAIKGDQWYINGRQINEGTPAEGLLMNVRMVNAVFEDRSGQLSKVLDFDPLANTRYFLSKIPAYASLGVNAFTVSLQGGNPGYEGAINTAFNPDGSLREDYLQRIEKVIRACDSSGMVVNLSLFYQRQHSYPGELSGKESILNAMENTVQWITQKGFTNVILEVSNEYRHWGFRSWQDGDWLISEEGQAELIRLARRVNPGLLVSTSGMGDGKFPESLAREADFILIHFNHTELDDYESSINELKKYGKPIVCNEDEKTGREAATAQALAVKYGCGWGFMYLRKNQWAPFVFSGYDDDPEVYTMFRKLTTPGHRIDKELLMQPSVSLAYPRHGEIFLTGQPVYVKVSSIFAHESLSSIELVAGGRKAGLVDDNLRLYWQPDSWGIHELEAVARDREGNILYSSPKVSVFVHRDRR